MSKERDKAFSLLSDELKPYFLNNNMFITGSFLVNGVTPNDIDIVIYFESQQDVFELTKSYNFSSVDTSLFDDARFMSVKDKMLNLILVWNIELFYRFKAFSGALSLIQFKDKKDRVALAIACLYD